MRAEDVERDIIPMPPGDYRDEAFKEAQTGWTPTSADVMPRLTEGDDGGAYARVASSVAGHDPVKPLVWCGNAYRIQVGVDDAGYVAGKSLTDVPIGGSPILAVRRWLDW
jgi:hypothetical protein